MSKKNLNIITFIRRVKSNLKWPKTRGLKKIGF